MKTNSKVINISKASNDFDEILKALTPEQVDQWLEHDNLSRCELYKRKCIGEFCSATPYNNKCVYITK